MKDETTVRRVMVLVSSAIASHELPNRPIFVSRQLQWPLRREKHYGSDGSLVSAGPLRG